MCEQMHCLDKTIPCIAPNANFFLDSITESDAMTLSADDTVFAFFGIDSSLSVHFFDYSFISGVKFMNRRKKSALFL